MKLCIHIDKLKNQLETIIQDHLEKGILLSGGRHPDGLEAKCKKALDMTLIDILLEKTKRNQTRMTQILGIGRVSMRNRLKKYGYL